MIDTEKKLRQREYARKSYHKTKNDKQHVPSELEAINREAVIIAADELLALSKLQKYNPGAISEQFNIIDARIKTLDIIMKYLQSLG